MAKQKRRRHHASPKTSRVMCRTPQEYKIADVRFNKPVCLTGLDGWAGKGKSTAVLQELSNVNIGGQQLTYFTPNNIGILLSVAKKNADAAKAFFNKHFDPNRLSLESVDSASTKDRFLNRKSKAVCNYIEMIQTSIVFSYTAIETFANLSIPDDYIYKVALAHKGTTELYDKPAIERWTSLKDKLLHILPVVYKTKKPNTKKIWSFFVKLENYRNEIIHQKTISSAEFYKAYFKKDIFKICTAAIDLLSFFYEETHKNNIANPLWPWLINAKNSFPLKASSSKEIELVK